MEMASQWREAEVAASFIVVLKQLPIDGTLQVGDKTMADWVAWAEEQLLKRNPINKGAEHICRSRHANTNSAAVMSGMIAR